ncbi:MAG TPA: hypothetical protein VLH10_23275 [Yinghuangia sp.]|uniref:hypothetical protein n=1 Tax=Yinghuangia sp. YIM S10712 TaxID=3436930 RepID=UPI002D147813|nr:hypothetical protein [Yinghuangia sp.]
MSDQPPPAPTPTPAPGPTGVAPSGIAPGSVPVPGATPSPAPGVNPYPVLPGFLPGIDPARAGGYTVNSHLLLPAASRADANADALLGLGTGLALGAPAGLPGFQTGWQAGALADAWSHELGALSSAVRTCATKIRETTRAYLEAEARNAADLR